MPWRQRGGVHLQLISLFTSAIEGRGWSTQRPGHFAPGKEPLYLFKKNTGWAQFRSGQVWRKVNPLPHPPAVQTPNRPARSKSLCLPRYPGPWRSKFLCICYATFKTQSVASNKRETTRCTKITVAGIEFRDYDIMRDKRKVIIFYSLIFSVL
jgi:hypothetical protein